MRKGEELEERTLAFATAIIAFVATFPSTEAALVVGRQVLRSGTSIGANYREANRAESKDDFAHKIAIAVKEAAETEYWLLLCARAKIVAPASVASLSAEINQLIAILTTILRRVRQNPT